MFFISGNDIYLSQGEAAAFQLIPHDDEGEYNMDIGDRLRLTVKDRKSGRTVLVKETEPGCTTFRFEEKDTANLAGKYDYKVELKYTMASPSVIVGKTAAFTPHFIVLEG